MTADERLREEPTPHRVIRIVAAVVRDERDHLLVVRKRGTSSFMQPGGKIEPGEEPLAALVREVREELGVGFDPATVHPLGQHHATAANEPGHVVDAQLYLVTLDGEPFPAAEIEEMTWIDPLEPGDIDLAPLTRHTVFELVRRLAG